jgi:hypothetical protein
MLKKIKLIIIKPMEWHLVFMGAFVIVLFYLQIIASPTIIIGLIGTIAFNFFEFNSAMNVVYGFLLIGFFIGVFWAERIRRSFGIVTFHSYLLSTPEIDGWRDGAGNKINRKSSKKNQNN